MILTPVLQMSQLRPELNLLQAEQSQRRDSSLPALSCALPPALEGSRCTPTPSPSLRALSSACARGPCAPGTSAHGPSPRRALHGQGRRASTRPWQMSLSNLPEVGRLVTASESRNVKCAGELRS